MSKTFSVAGVSTVNGAVKYRVANSLARVAALEKAGQTNIKLIELPSAMTKEEAFEFIANHPDFQAIKPATIPSVKGGVPAKDKTEKTGKKAA